MDIKKLTNTELVKLCAREPRNRNAWLEFYSRFDERIWLVVFRECRANITYEMTSQLNQVVQDLVQEVYLRLVEKKCKALKAYEGACENSIYIYLGTIAKNVVRNYVIKMAAQKRPSIEKFIYDTSFVTEGGRETLVSDRFQSNYGDIEDEFRLEILEEEIEDILDKCLKGKDRERNKIIFKLYFYEGFSSEEITSQFSFNLSSKRIGNIISEVKQELRKKLLQRKMAVY